MVINTMTRSSLWRKGFISSYSNTPSLRKVRQELKTETCRQELKQKPWKNFTYWLLFNALLILSSYTTQDHLLRSVTVHSDMGPPTSVINQVYDTYTYLPTNLIEALPEWPSLYQGEKNRTITNTDIKNIKRKRWSILTLPCPTLWNLVLFCLWRRLDWPVVNLDL